MKKPSVSENVVTDAYKQNSSSTYHSNDCTSTDGITGNPKFLVIWSNDTLSCTCKHFAKYKQKGHVDLHPAVVNFFEEYIRSRFSNIAYVDWPDSITIKCYTEYKRDNIRFRAHPNYHSRGPWYDWSKIIWENDDGVNTLVPGKIVAFFSIPWQLCDEFINLTINNAQSISLKEPNNYVEQLMAVVHSCHANPISVACNNSKILQTWRLEYQPVATSNCPSVYVVQDVRRNPDTPFSQFENLDATTPPSASSTNLPKKIYYRKIQLRTVAVACLDTVVLMIEEEPGMRESFTSDKNYLTFAMDPLVLVCSETHTPNSFVDRTTLHLENISDSNSVVDVPDLEPTWVDHFLELGNAD